MSSRNATFSLVVLAALILLGLSSTFRVYETKQALVLQFGDPERTVKEAGLHFKWPWESVILMDKRILLLDMPVQELITSDQKRVLIDAYARFRLADPLKVYQAVGDQRIAANRLGTILNSNLRQVIGSQPFSAILSQQRVILRQKLLASVATEGQQLGIQVIDVRVKRTDLPEENSEAIFKRMKAEREREAKQARAQGAELAQGIRSNADRQRTVILADAQRQADISRGEGDAEAAKTFAQAFDKDPEFFAFYRSMQAYSKAFDKDDTTMVLSPGSGFLKYFNEDKSLGK